MDDIFHYFGDDISAGATGDLLRVSDSTKGQQRILRRLLTNPREVLPDGSILPPDYVFHPEYGAGLRRKVGTLLDIPKLTALIRGQMLLEESVAKTPEPVIKVAQIQGGVSVNISYVDAVYKKPQALSFDVNR